MFGILVIENFGFALRNSAQGGELVEPFSDFEIRIS